MNWSFRTNRAPLAITCCLLLFFAASGISQENRSNSDSERPLTFQVSDASIEMYKRGGYTIGVVADTIILRGTGEGEWTEIRSAQQLHNKYHVRYSAYDFVGLLRIFFVNQFFTFGPTYTGYKSLLDPASDGTVHTLQSVTVDAGTITLVVRIDDYVKSIVFIPGKSFSRKPACLDSLAQEVEYFTKKHTIVDKDPE
jgi:hypothetical protein